MAYFIDTRWKSDIYRRYMKFNVPYFIWFRSHPTIWILNFEAPFEILNGCIHGMDTSKRIVAQLSLYSPYEGHGIMVCIELGFILIWNVLFVFMNEIYAS